MGKKRLNQSTKLGRAAYQRKSPLSLALKLGVGTVVLFYIFSAFFSQVERDELTLCRIDRAYPRETALLLDTTGGYSAAQATAISANLNKLLTDSQIDEKFTFYSLGVAPGSYYQNATICNPGDGSDQGDLTVDQASLYAGWQKNFNDRIVSSVNDLVGQQAAEQSPIMEMIQYVSRQISLSPPDTPKRLIIVSNMIHKTPEYSQYGDSLNFNSLAGTAYLDRVQARLAGVEVGILYVLRPQLLGVQNRGHIEQFWRPYVNFSEGSIVSTERISLE